ncbi:MAG TPA: hypothetical protein VL354_16990 [Spirochaetia bacterium]|nr:hypothetical protein [Spirochaetia bacterium]
MSHPVCFSLIVAGAVFLLAVGQLHASGQREGAGLADAKSCADCHASTNPRYPFLGEKARYEVSGHKLLGNAAYANGDGCQVCHTNEGFISSIEKGNPDPKDFVANPSQPGCFTCHEPHEKGDFRLRTATPVTLANGKVFDVGDGNLCASCHRATAVAAQAVTAMPANTIAAYWGSHHGPQADIVAGTNAYEFPGKTYGSSAHKDVINDGCVSCHMSLPKGRAGLSLEIGGHSCEVVGKVHGTDTLNLAACISCHRDIRQAPGRAVFNIIAQEDYDQNGKKEPFQVEVQGLLDRFVNREGTGLLQTLNPPFYTKDGAFVWSKSDAVRPISEVAAFYNYRMIVDDRSLGIHNTKYVIQILYDTIQALDPHFDVSRRPQ